MKQLKASLKTLNGILDSGKLERNGDEWKKVTKYTGIAAKDVEELNEEFKKMDTKTSREALNDLAADAGRLGLKGKKDVLDFVQAADQINTALGEDLGEGAVKNIGKLANIFGDDQRLGLKQAMLSTASAINELAQRGRTEFGAPSLCVHINASFLDIFGCARHNPDKLGFCSRLAQTLVQLYHGEKTSVVNEHCVKQNKRNVRVRIMSESRKETVKQESTPD
ncbi:MAG: phage tail tape measure protein [Alloprevotella sp.]